MGTEVDRLSRFEVASKSDRPKGVGLRLPMRLSSFYTFVEMQSVLLAQCHEGPTPSKPHLPDDPSAVVALEG
ncbi:unnamed protein product [Protopolystoma xenopodis]|uniref:Uncharacterized protein n=1 Tax=Protopolystoma xenopodis TaxID=117903 RepID=A0A448X3C2_9PLAT|nr:unnamed protein product [Protopolystoma xenopodis]